MAKTKAIFENIDIPTMNMIQQAMQNKRNFYNNKLNEHHNEDQ